MNAKVFGATISALRKKSGMTQSSLAEALNVSDKAVSKWETGAGFPEITLLPKIAGIFGVTVDYLVNGERRGITLAGSTIADIVKTIDYYPEKGMLAHITGVSRAVGGCVPNTAINLAKIDGSIPISTVSCVGDDDHGHYIISQLRKYNIDTDNMVLLEGKSTSFTDVMSLPSGERTFFAGAGADSLFNPEHVDLSKLSCSILHIGYIMLLKSFDAEDPEYGTVMARFLHDVQKQGIKTSVDVVSDLSKDFKSKVLPALKYCDYLIVNEIECCALLGVSPRDENEVLSKENLRKAMEYAMECGVSEKVIVHAKEAGFCLSKDGSFTAVPSLEVPPEDVKGSVGAGDTFCAGSLYGIYNNYSDQEILEFASAAAVCNLFAENSIDGMKNKEGVLEVMKKYPRKKL